MQIVNDYEKVRDLAMLLAANGQRKDVFNGELGRIHAIAEDGTVTVRFAAHSAWGSSALRKSDDDDDDDGGVSGGTPPADHRDVLYKGEELRDIDAAYACTIHKAQGG